MMPFGNWLPIENATIKKVSHFDEIFADFCITDTDPYGDSWMTGG